MMCLCSALHLSSLWAISHGSHRLAAQLEWEVEVVLLLRCLECCAAVAHHQEPRVAQVGTMQLVIIRQKLHNAGCGGATYLCTCGEGDEVGRHALADSQTNMA